MKFFYCVWSALILCAVAWSDTGAIRQTKGSFQDKFRQLDTDLPTPNAQRTASGAPGPDYWQQRADYRIQAQLDDQKRQISGQAVITYHNESPHRLDYLWVQLDQNRFADGSMARLSETVARSGTRREAPGKDNKLSYSALRRQYALGDTRYGFQIKRVGSSANRTLPYTIVDTMMRIDLPRPLDSGDSQDIHIEWVFNLIHEEAVGGRSGYETFEDGSEIYFAAQWFPRMAAYTDYGGWQNKAFLGRGEFTLEFGDYDVTLKVPSNHIVSATGVLLNSAQVLSSQQRARLAEAEQSDNPVFIVTPEEALANQSNSSSSQPSESRSWRFRAKNVRDFAWASSPKFIWDAQGLEQKDGPDVMAMSFYPIEAEPLWSKYSTRAVIHAVDIYSRFSFPYPYPTVQSVNTWKRGGMEYPMITFNGYRPEEADDEVDQITWSRRTKAGLIGVIIHEVGHIYFPMIVNSDERQWTWMDEGLNTFIEYMAELEWEENFPAFREHTNVLDYVPDYMRSSRQVPIMTQADSLLRPGPNAYFKPTAALTILRETVMGRDLFDHAFKTYAQRWKFRRPTPADFFRTMEDASGIDLDWFWRGWFYSTDNVDIALDSVREYTIATGNPELDFPVNRQLHHRQTPETLSQKRNLEEGRVFYTDRHPELRDFYNTHDRFTVSNADRKEAALDLEDLEAWERQVLDRAIREGKHVYFVDFKNIGGLVMPLPLRISFSDGSTEDILLPAEIWRSNPKFITRLFIRDAPIVAIALDPDHRIADADHSNNDFPSQIKPERLTLNKPDYPSRNLMRDMLVPDHQEEAP